MQCLQLTRGEPPATTIAVTITGSGNARYCYATINGTKQYRAGTHEVNVGDTITFGVYGTKKHPGTIIIDGTKVLSAINQTTETYDWTVPSVNSDIKIAMAYSSKDGSSITVDTNKSHTGGSN